jgi:hypothetical protein
MCQPIVATKGTFINIPYHMNKTNEEKLEKWAQWNVRGTEILSVQDAKSILGYRPEDSCTIMNSTADSSFDSIEESFNFHDDYTTSNFHKDVSAAMLLVSGVALMNRRFPKILQENNSKISLGLDGGVMNAALATMILKKRGFSKPIIDRNEVYEAAQIAKALRRKGLTRSPDGQTFVKKATMSMNRNLYHLVKRTETTRPKKELSPEDIRDFDTVRGMKSHAGLEKERRAKDITIMMISSGMFQHNEKASVIAFFSDGRTVNPLV